MFCSSRPQRLSTHEPRKRRTGRGGYPNCRPRHVPGPEPPRMCTNRWASRLNCYNRPIWLRMVTWRPASARRSGLNLSSASQKDPCSEPSSQARALRGPPPPPTAQGSAGRDASGGWLHGVQPVALDDGFPPDANVPICSKGDVDSPCSWWTPSSHSKATPSKQCLAGVGT